MKKINFLLMAVTLMLVIVPASWAQMATVKGLIKNVDGKPLAGATVQMTDKETARNYQIKTDKNGTVFSLGIAPGTYNIVLLGPDGKQIYAMNGFPVRSGDEAALNIDLQKEMATQQASMSTEQKKAIEQQSNERNKIKSLNDMLAQARAANEAGNYDQAKEIMLKATQTDPTKEILWFQLAEAQQNSAAKNPDANQKKADLQASIESYNKALNLTPQTKPDVLGAIHNNMGQAYTKMGNIDQAAKEYDEAAGIDVTHAGMYYFNEGAVLTNSGKYDAAIAAFDKAVQADPTKADAYYQKGVNLLGKATTKPDGTVVAPEGTAEAFNKYLELDPSGKYADSAKQMLAMIGAKVETSFGKSKTKKK